MKIKLRKIQEKKKEVILVKTVQEWLKEVDIEQLINEYFYTYPVKVNDIREEDSGLTIKEVKERRRKMMEKYINRLINLKVKSSDDGDDYILFAYNVFMEDFENIDYALVSKKELLESDFNERVCDNYSFMLSNQEEIMGYLVADTNLTKINICGLLVYVLYEASWFGYENEGLEEEKQKLEEATKEIEEGKYSSFTIEDMREELGLPGKEQDEKQEELLKKIFHTTYNFSQYSFKKEARRVKRELIDELTYMVKEFINDKHVREEYIKFLEEKVKEE